MFCGKRAQAVEIQLRVKALKNSDAEHGIAAECGCIQHLDECILQARYYTRDGHRRFLPQGDYARYLSDTFTVKFINDDE